MVVLDPNGRVIKALNLGSKVPAKFKKIIDPRKKIPAKFSKFDEPRNYDNH